jgi:septal ring factor EnvC (AmiA/AmiB activator)
LLLTFINHNQQPPDKSRTTQLLTRWYFKLQYRSGYSPSNFPSQNGIRETPTEILTPVKPNTSPTTEQQIATLTVELAKVKKELKAERMAQTRLQKKHDALKKETRMKEEWSRLATESIKVSLANQNHLLSQIRERMEKKDQEIRELKAVLGE